MTASTASPTRTIPARPGRAPAVLTSWAWSCQVRLVVEDRRTLDDAAHDLDVLLDRVDAAASRFRTDSVLSRANDCAGRPTPIPALLVDLIGAALGAALRTGGAVDPTLGATLARLGYDRDFAALPEDADGTPEPARRAGWRDVVLDHRTGLLTVPPGTALDLGATAKAYTADLAARTLHRVYGTSVLVEIGGDLAVAGGRDAGWLVRVAERAGDDGPIVRITHGGLATSTTTVRRWRSNGRAVHHIVDPVTLRPTTGPWRTVTVHAESALEANTASTAAIVLGERAVPWLDEQRLAARLVRDDGYVTTTAGWPR